MKLETIYQFFEHPQLRYLNKEQTVCYVLSELIKEDAYASELIDRVQRQYPLYRLSDTVFYKSMRFLDQEALVTTYVQKRSGRGRPRKMLTIAPEALPKATDLAQLWRQYVADHTPVESSSSKVVAFSHSSLQCKSV